MKTRLSSYLACTAWLCVCGNALAVQTWLVLRDEGPMALHSGLTAQIVDTNFGTNLDTMPFSGTTTYDFYSPALTSPVSLAPSDMGGGMIYMRNTSTANANDFSVTGEMKFYDYNPGTGSETLLVDTTASGAKDVNHSQTVNWPIPNAQLPANTTIAAGHMVHIAMTIALVSGNPGGFGQVVYNSGTTGPSTPCTSGFLPQNRGTVLNWPFDSAPLPPSLSIYPQSNGQVVVGVYGAASTSFSLQATTNLATPNWVTLVSTNTDVNGLYNYVDQDAKNYPCRFYRSFTH